jgi:hypothetical protein
MIRDIVLWIWNASPEQWAMVVGGVMAVVFLLALLGAIFAGFGAVVAKIIGKPSLPRLLALLVGAFCMVMSLAPDVALWTRFAWPIAGVVFLFLAFKDRIATPRRQVTPAHATDKDG